MKAIVLLKLTSPEMQAAFAHLKRIAAVTEAYAVYGRYDAVAMIQAANLEEIRRILLSEVHCIPGVIEILPCVIVENDYPAPATEFSTGPGFPFGPEHPHRR